MESENILHKLFPDFLFCHTKQWQHGYHVASSWQHDYFLLSPEQFCTTCATSSWGLLATTGNSLLWMPDVVCQLVGTGMILGYVINGEGGSARDATQRKVPCERAHTVTHNHHVWGMLPSALYALCKFHSACLPVQWKDKLCAQYAAHWAQT